MITLDLRQPRPVHRASSRTRAPVIRRRCSSTGESGKVTRLDGASAPPIGVAEPADIVEARVGLSDHVGARDVHGRPDRAARAEHRRWDRPSRPSDRDGAETLDLDRIVRNVSAVIGAPDDDVALLVIAMDGARTAFDGRDTGRAVGAAGLAPAPARWLARRGCDERDSRRRRARGQRGVQQRDRTRLRRSRRVGRGSPIDETARRSEP